MLDWLAQKHNDDDCKQAGEVIEQALMSVYTEAWGCQQNSPAPT